MIRTLAALIGGAQARAEDRVRDAFALELIDQSIRQAETSLRAAKATLASLIQRERSEDRHIQALASRHADLTQRTREALAAGRDDLAMPAAEAIAAMENELALRQATHARLQAQSARLRASVEAAQRRVIDLKQGAVQARAVRCEQDIQTRLTHHLTNNLTPAPADEAEELISRVLGRDDPFEQSRIMAEIEADLSHAGIARQLESHGFGPATRATAATVLARLRTN